AFSYANLISNGRAAQLTCVMIQIFVLYSNSDYIGSGTFILATALCLYNFYVLAKRWVNSIDGRFDMRQMVREKDTQLKLMYAAEVFTPFIVGLLVYSMVMFPGKSGNFMWTCACCVQITAALMLILAEVYEVFIKGY
ncbi:hypothetical protein V3C99_005858, partial [Haemonchus contortus]